MRGNSVKVDILPTKNDVEKSWEEIWEKTRQFNQQAEWLKLLENSYCTTVKPKDYMISNETVQRAIKNLQTKNSSGLDLITGFWYNNLPSLVPYLARLFEKSLNNSERIAEWLAQEKTVLLPKNAETHVVKN